MLAGADPVVLSCVGQMRFRHEHQLREARARAVEQALGTQAAKTAKSKRGAKAQKPPPKPAHTELDTPTDASLETANSDGATGGICRRGPRRELADGRTRQRIVYRRRS